MTLRLLLVRLLAALVVLMPLFASSARAEGTAAWGSEAAGSGRASEIAPPTHEGGTADAPRLGERLEPPTPPADYLTHDAGFARFHYHPSVERRVRPLLRDADAVRLELATRLGAPVLERVQVFVARTPREMATFAPKGTSFAGYAAGVAYSEIGLVLLTVDPVSPGSVHDLGEVFRHELAHVALHDAVRGAPVPRWFNEGFAVFASGESSLVRFQALWTAALAGNLLSLEEMERTFPANADQASVAYAEAADILRFLVRTQERHRFTAMIERLRHGSSFAQAMSGAYGVEPSLLEQEWREDVAKRYTFWPVLLSGTTVWTAAMLLFVWAWRRKKRNAQETLDRWLREEAAEELRARALVIQTVRMDEPSGRRKLPLGDAPYLGAPSAGVPKVQHDGDWHTLH